MRSGVLPRLPVDFATLERRATAAMPKAVLDYVQGGCGDEATQNRNATAFRHWGMVPRMMVDCTTRDLSIELLGMTLPTPVFMAPIGVNGIRTPDGHGDIAAACAAAETGVPFSHAVTPDWFRGLRCSGGTARGAGPTPSRRVDPGTSPG